MKVAVAALALVCLSASAGMSQQEADRFIRSNKRQVIAELKDPGSAQFRSLFVSISMPMGDQGLQATSLCGEVNARNSYGGYAGFHRFYAVQDGFARIERDDDPVFAMAWERMCTNKIN